MKIAMRDLNSYGIVGVIEPGIDERQMALYRAVHDAGEMTVRTDVLYRALRKADVEKGIAAIKAQKNDDMLRFVGIKFPLDGGVEGGRMSWPYRIVPGEQTDASYRGVLLLPPGGEDEYVAGLKLIAEAGLQAQTHAVGDETIDVIVRAYERVNDARPIRDLRWTIMHLFDSFGCSAEEDGGDRHHGDRCRIIPSCWATTSAAGGATIMRAMRFSIRKTIDAGVLVGGGTDGPVVPVDPFLSMWWMTTRQVLKGYALGTEHAITAKEALTLYTINNARIMGVEKERGWSSRASSRTSRCCRRTFCRRGGRDPRDEGADDGGWRQGGLSQRDLRRIPRRSASPAVPKLRDKAVGSYLRRIRSKFSRIGPEQNRLCCIADIEARARGGSCSENRHAPDHVTFRSNEFPADAHGPVAGHIRRNCFVTAPATAVRAHAPIDCRSRRTPGRGTRQWSTRNRNIEPY